MIRDKKDRSYIASEETSKFLKVEGKWLYLDGDVSEQNEEILSEMIEKWVPAEVIAEDSEASDQE